LVDLDLGPAHRSRLTAVCPAHRSRLTAVSELFYFTYSNVTVTAQFQGH